MKWNLTSLIGALLALTLIAAACGSDEESATTDTTPTEQTSDTGGDTTADEGHDDDSHGDGDNDSHNHDHVEEKFAEVADGDPVPEVTTTFTATDTPGEFDLVIELVNFTITPDAVDGPSVPNEGHMHLLVDGEKVDRFYDLERSVSVPAGEHLVEVELNTNDHQVWTYQGEPLRSGETLTGHGEAPAAPEPDVSIEATLSERDVTLEGDERVEVALGQVVEISVAADIDEEIHVHGFDLFADVTPDEPAVINFTADTPGRFEVEFETSGTFIVELVVS